MVFSQTGLLEEIIVTADGREVGLQNLPLPVTAYTADNLETLGINGLSELDRVVPSLSVNTTQFRVSIRGISRFSINAGISPAIGLYVNNFYSEVSLDLLNYTLNTDRVEVLRGPQGTLYGRNSTGGSINVLTRRPGENLEAELRLKAGDYDWLEVQGLVQGPITESLGGKLYVYRAERDGLQDNTAGKDTNSDNGTEAMEAQLDWAMTEQLNLRLIYNGLRADSTPRYAALDAPYNAASPSVIGIAPSSQYQAANFEGLRNRSLDDVHRVAISDPGSTQYDQDNVTVFVDYAFEGGSVSYIGGHWDWHADGSPIDLDLTASELYRTLNKLDGSRETTSHELRYVSNFDSPLQLIGGLYYYQEDLDLLVNFHTSSNPGQSAVLGGYSNPRNSVLALRGVSDTEGWAVYSQVDYAFSDSWNLTAGLRYSDDDLEGWENLQLYFDPASGSPAPYAGSPFVIDISPLAGPDNSLDVPGQGGDSHAQGWDKLTGKLSLQYTPSERHLFWGTLSTGYKIGGFNLGAMANISGNPLVADHYDPEELVNYELGWRASNDALKLELVGYYYDYRDYQQQFQVLVAEGQQITTPVNIDAEMHGIEGSVAWAVSNSLQVMGIYSYNHSSFDDDRLFFNNLSEQFESVDGNDAIDMPRHKVGLNGVYLWSTAWGAFSMGATWSWQDQREFDVFNNDLARADSFSRLDLMGSWTSTSGKVTLLGQVTNALDDDDIIDNVGVNANAPGIDPQRVSNYGDPRVWSVELQLRL